MAEEEDQLMTVVVGEHVDEEPLPEQRPVEQWPTDEVCAAAIDVARGALLEEVPADHVGEVQGLSADGPLVVTHYFAGHVPGYQGWRWAVTVTRAPDSDHVTVDETALLPDSGALLAPPWVPWTQRIQSGDLGAGDIMVTEADDARLIPGMAEDDVPESEDELLPSLWERGLGRERMLSPDGLREAAHRWYRELGPRSAVARATDLHCQTCGFLLLIGGPLGQAFGVCANGFSPADGRVVAMNFGCGAHSETIQIAPTPVADTVVDETGFQDLDSVPDPVAEVVEEGQAATAAESDASDEPTDASAEAEQGSGEAEQASTAAESDLSDEPTDTSAQTEQAGPSDEVDQAEQTDQPNEQEDR